MDELHASKTVAAKVRAGRRQLEWSMRRLAALSGISEERIESIENGRRRRGVTVDELMILAHALETPSRQFLPPDSDYWTDEQKQKSDEDVWREFGKPRREITVEVMRFMEILFDYADKVRGEQVVIGIERDGKLVDFERLNIEADPSART